MATTTAAVFILMQMSQANRLFDNYHICLLRILLCIFKLFSWRNGVVVFPEVFAPVFLDKVKV